jgi:hypothetical protein
MGKFEEAEALLTRQLEILTKGLGEQHPMTFSSQAELTLGYQDQVRYDLATKLIETRPGNAVEKLGSGHEAPHKAMVILAQLHLDQDRLEDAEKEVKALLHLLQPPSYLWPSPSRKHNLYGEFSLGLLQLRSISGSRSPYVKQSRLAPAEELGA